MSKIESQIQISQNFDSGNIEVLHCDQAHDIRLAIKHDYNSEFYQWFHFRLTGARDQACTLNIINGGGAAYPLGFENYRVLYSYDRKDWKRHHTNLTNGVLSISFTPKFDSVYFAYFIPYSLERHQNFVSESLKSPLCSLKMLGKTLDGRDLDLLTINDSLATANKKQCWIIARQHPGESMAEWWMEGAIQSLLDVDNAVAKSILSTCTVHFVPNMNPDGSFRGHLRTNAAGRNLNREWADADINYCPEVFLVKKAMAETGVDFFLDVHGDESLPYCFIAGTEGLSNWDEPQQQQLDFYRNELAATNSDFQTKIGYPAKAPGQANLTMSTVQTAHLYQCLAMTLEMPFKDTIDTPNETFGWSVSRCKRLGESCLEVMDSYVKKYLL